MKKAPNTVSHLAAKARVVEAKQALEKLEYARAHSPNGHLGNAKLWQAKIDLARAELELHEGAQAYNRAAPDLEALRNWLLAELATARAALDVAPPSPPAPLESADPEALTAHVEAGLAYRQAHHDHIESIAPIHNRILAAYDAVRDAQALTVAARKAANMPAAAPVIVGYITGAPGTVAAIDQAMASIEAQRVPDSSRGHVMTHHERRVKDAEKDLADFLAAEATAAESRMGAA